MFRMGYYTGKVYEETINRSDIHECTFPIDYRKFANANDLAEFSAEIRRKCVGCYQCEEAKKRMGGN